MHPDWALSLALLGAVLAVAKIAGDLAARVGQPPVLGELLAGMLLAATPLADVGGIGHDPVIAALAELGVVVLLFEVGLESTVHQVARVGRSALLVALLGVVAPFALGWAVGVLFLPAAGWTTHAFLGAALTATSVGITARVFADLGQRESPEARVILGAAVLDDVLGLVILAGVGMAIRAVDAGESLALGPIALVAAKALLFLGGAIALGLRFVPPVLRGASHLRGSGVLLGLALAFCFLAAAGAQVAGLAPIVGAFAAGLVLERAHYEPFVQKGERPLEELIAPVSQVLAPIFFVRMGTQVDLGALAQPGAALLCGVLVVAAVVGKQLCMLGVVDPGIRRVPVGIGMIPRGEVGLVFASMGATMTVAGRPVLDEAAFAAVVGVVVLTTLVTPPLLAVSLRRR